MYDPRPTGVEDTAVKASITVAVGLAVLVLSTAASAAVEDRLLRAMADEAARSMAELRLEELDRPYFVAYRIDDIVSRQVVASFGSTVERREDRRRFLTVEVRVGDYSLDNTNFLALPGFRDSAVGGFGGVQQLPLEDDDRELRRQLWLTTDAAYKRALETLARKQATLKTRTRAEETPDFSRQEPFTDLADAATAAPTGDPGAAEQLVVGLSAIFREGDMAGVSASEVSFEERVVLSRYLNSEGTRYRRRTGTAAVVATAATQAEDGVPITDAVSFHAEEVEGLAERRTMEAAIRALGRRVTGARRAATLDRYNGPVLFEGQAAVELFAQVFAPKLLAQRRPVVGDERLARSLTSEEADFKDRLGARVLPRALKVVDDATLREIAGQPALGGYAVDDEGVPASPTLVVERGYLKTLLSGRVPVLGVAGSTGNAREGGVAPSNLIVDAEAALAPQAMRQELLLLVADRGAEHGVIVRRLTPSGSERGSPGGVVRQGSESRRRGAPPEVLVAVKVYPDGREEPLRSLELSGLSAATFKEIVAVSERGNILTVPFEPPRSDPFAVSLVGQRGAPRVTLRVPDLLFEEVTLKRPSGEIPRPPVAGHPFFSEARARR